MSDVISISRQHLVFKEKIGEGGFSTVYRMIWKTEDGDKQVAAKRLNKIDRRELTILAALNHKHIVQLLGVVDEQIDFMLVLELCEGGSLRSYLDRQNNKKLPLAKLLDWAEQAALPIQYLKEKGVIHKDIKAANYLIAKENVLKLADFGLAKNTDKTQSNATGRGTWGWMAPELLIESILSTTFDIYAYAVTLWELTTTEVPFKDMEYQMIVFHVCQNGMRPTIPNDCPKELQDLMKRCWHSDRRQRPSIDDVLAVIRKAKQAEIRRSLDHSSHESANTTRVELSRQPSMGVWIYESQFVKCRDNKLSDPRGIAVDIIHARVIIADGGASKVNVYNMEGHLQFPMSTKNGNKPGERSKPHQVAVSSAGVRSGEGRYFVTDGTSVVKEFHKNGSFKGTFPTVDPSTRSVSDSTNESKLEGLAIDMEGHLLVGDVSKLCISKYATNETHTHEGHIQVSIQPYDLAVTHQNDIVVSSYKNHTVQVVNQQGVLLRSIKPPMAEVPQWCPYGVACDHALLFVCNWATDKGRGVHCYTLSKFDYLGCIIPSDGCPRGLALIENESKLLVTQLDAGLRVIVNVYRRR
ncbi:uncharacterized protein [Amphiura filiformis]|uniref:uncharacterized protein n=1 Tax=Amphiura filiformis TaxID=82378 RepID=UPI003B2219F6